MRAHRWLLVGACPAVAVVCATMAVHAGARPATVVPAAVPARDVHLEWDMALAWIFYRIDLRVPEGDRPVVGAMRIRTASTNRALIERKFGCVTHTIDPSPHDNTPMWECAVAFHRGAPNWETILQRLDSLGIMAPPRDPPPAPDSLGHHWIMICSDGAPWRLEVRMRGDVVVHDEQVCGWRSARRAAYETGIEAVLDSIISAGEVR